tara:strand:- start:45827 stop:46726 length:900 start_codon:yes stop_codon:yes gene_type:complete
LLGFSFIVLACALWAVDTLIRYPLAGQMSASSIVFYEHLLLSVIFSVVFFKAFSAFKHIKFNHIISFVIIGMLGSALATLAFTRAFMFLNPSIVIILQKFQPVIAVSLAAFVLKEKVNKYFMLWAFVSLVGAVLISYEDLLNIVNSESQLSELFFHDGAALGYILVMFTIFGWGAATVFGKKLTLEGYSNEQIMAGRFLFGLLAMVPFYFIDNTFFTHNVEVYSKVSLMVLLSGLLAMYLYYMGLRRTSARSATLAEMFFPFMAVIVNWLFLDARLTAIQMFGGGILLLGSLVIQLKKY